jgi:hypothetical protein
MIMIMIIIIIIMNMLMRVQQNSFAHIRVLLVLTDRGILAQSNERRSLADFSYAGMTFRNQLTGVSAVLRVCSDRIYR